MEAWTFARRRTWLLSLAVGIALGLALVLGWVLTHDRTSLRVRGATQSTAQAARLADDGGAASSPSALLPTTQAAIRLDLVPEEAPVSRPNASVTELEPIHIEGTVPGAQMGPR